MAVVCRCERRNDPEEAERLVTWEVVCYWNEVWTQCCAGAGAGEKACSYLWSDVSIVIDSGSRLGFMLRGVGLYFKDELDWSFIIGKSIRNMGGVGAVKR